MNQAEPLAVTDELSRLKGECARLQSEIQSERAWTNLYKWERNAAEEKLERIRERAERLVMSKPDDDEYGSCMASDNSGDVADAAERQALAYTGVEILAIINGVRPSPHLRPPC